MEKEGRQFKLVGPTILIGIGIILLLNNLGYLNWSFWDILSLWPILLIAAGLEILIGKRSAIGSFIAALIVLGLLIGGVWLIGVADGVRTSAQSITISEPRDGTKSAQVTLAPDVAQLNIKALNDSGNFVEGMVEQRDNEKVIQDFSGGTPARLILKTTGGASGKRIGPSRHYTWDLAFHPEVALDLNIDAGVGDMNLDLSELMLDAVNINFGVGDLLLKLPPNGDCNISIDGGVGMVVIEVPAGLAVRIQSDTAIVASDMPQGYTKVNNRYTSPGYDKAEARIDIRVGLGVGNLMVREIP